MDDLRLFERLLFTVSPSIWRCADSYEWEILRENDLLSFKYLQQGVDYKDKKNLPKQGITSVKAWVSDLKIGNLIFIIGRYYYSGIAIAESEYDVNGPFLDWENETTSAIHVRYLHKLHEPVEHDLQTHNNPATFTRVYNRGFDLDKIISFLYNYYPEAIKELEAYVNEQIESIIKEERIARIAFNTNEWVKPSGKFGKSKDKETHEGEYRYGHEEWIFDLEKTINGYHYGFLQPINKAQQKYENNLFNIQLYTIDGNSSERISVGQLNNSIVISRDEAELVKSYYQDKNWLDEMNTQIKQVGGNNAGYKDSAGILLFNIKFKPEDIVFDPIILPENHPFHNIKRYTFANLLDNQEFTDNHENIGEFVFGSNSTLGNGLGKGRKRGSYKRRAKQVDVTYLHEHIGEALLNILSLQYGSQNVVAENLSGIGMNKIDMVLKKPKSYTFYEIKTLPSLKLCVREAIGQLLEYALYPNRQIADELIIVSFHKPTETNKAYLQYLRLKTNLKIFYQQLDLKTKNLGDKI